MQITACVSCALLITFLTLLSTCQGQAGARFIATPSDSYYVTRGRPASIVCEAENVNSISFTCSKDIPVNRLQVVGRVLDSGVETVKGTLKITKEDIKGYSAQSPFWCECVGDDISGTPIRSRRSEIKSAFLKKEFVKSPKSKSAPIGRKVELMCSPPAGQPSPTISWLKQGKKINIGKDKNLVLDSRGMLVIKKLRQKDLGKYSCLARNPAAKRISSVAVLSVGDASVEDRLEASDSPLTNEPIYEKEPDSLYYATADTPVDISCKVIGASILTVRCNNRRLLDSEQRKQESQSAQGIIFETTFSVSSDDIRRYEIDGSYSCYCVSWYTSPGSSGWLSKKSAKGYVELAFMDEQFVAEPASQDVGTDSSVTLICSPPKSKPPAEIKWIFNGAALNTGYAVIGDDGSLTIESVSSRDTGDYQCSAENEAGVRYSANARLTVTEGFIKKETAKVETVRPSRGEGEAYFSIPLENVYYLSEQDPVAVTCGVKNADMVTFRCNGRRYTEDEITSEKNYNRKVGKFDITSSISVKSEDLKQGRGDYKCICTMWYTVDGNWEREESVEAKIEKAFIEEEFSMEPVDSQVQIGVPTELMCSPPFGGPEPEVSWIKDGERVDVSRDRNVEITVSGSLSIMSMRRKYVGSYTCVASNPAGVLYSRAASLTVFDSAIATDAITESILVDGASTAEPEEYTPYSEPEPTSESETGVAHGALPMFTEEPDDIYYIVKASFITITCAAKNVHAISFRCSGYTVPDYRYENNAVSSSDMVVVSLELSREDVEGFTDDNTCICDAFYRRQGSTQEESISSKPGYINLAYIKKRFLKNPEDTNTMEGMMAALPCTPPEAVPRPTVYWLFNGRRVLGSNIVQPNDNSLVFVNPTHDQAGDYTCIAENMAGQRTSNTARLTVEVPQGGVVDPEVDQTYPETTAEPEAEVEIGTTEPEPEGEGEGYVTSESYVTKDMEYISAVPEVSSEYTTSSYRGNAVEPESQPTVESDSTDVSKMDTDESVVMATDESVTDRAITTKSVETKPMVTESMEIKPMKTETMEIKPMTTESMEIKPTKTETMEIKPMTTETMEIKPMTTETVKIKSMTTETMEIKPMVTENMESSDMTTGIMSTKHVGNEIDSMSPTDTSEKSDKMTTKGSKKLKPKPTSKKFKKCQEKMSLCNRYFTEQVRPAEENQDTEAKCRAAAEYSMCVDDFVDKCRNEIKENAIDTILYTRERLTSSCRDDEDNVVVDTNLGPYESCNELQMCTRHLTDGDSPMFDDLNSACNSLTSMLMCGDSALSKCNIENSAGTGTSLSTIGEWYSNYCNKIIMERNSFVTCESLRPCNTPLNASTSVRDIYDVNVWCPYTHNVIACTMNAVDTCQPEERSQIETDLRMLKSEALKICPRPGQEPEVIDVGESQNPNDSGVSLVYSRSSILLSLVHVVFLLVLSLR